MFLYLLFALLLGFGLHLYRSAERSRTRAAELLLRWVLVGYCGVPMVGLAILMLLDPPATLSRFGVTGDGMVVTFFAWAYLGMSLGAVSSLALRRSALVAPALVWATFFLGATSIHLHAGHGGGHTALLHVLGSHLLISLLLVGGVAAGGARDARPA